MFMMRPDVGMSLTIMSLSGVTFMMMAPLAVYGKPMAGLKSIANGAMIFVGITTEAGKKQNKPFTLLYRCLLFKCTRQGETLCKTKPSMYTMN